MNQVTSCTYLKLSIQSISCLEAQGLPSGAMRKDSSTPFSPAACMHTVQHNQLYCTPSHSPHSLQTRQLRKGSLCWAWQISGIHVLSVITSFKSFNDMTAWTDQGPWRLRMWQGDASPALLRTRLNGNRAARVHLQVGNSPQSALGPLWW